MSRSCHPLFYICCFKQSPNHSKSDVYILSLTKTQIIPNQIPPLEIPKGQIEITWNHLEIRPFCPCNASVVKQDAQVPTHQAITGFVMRPFFLAWQYRTWCAFWDHVSHVRVQNWSKFSEIQISILRVKPLTIDAAKTQRKRKNAMHVQRHAMTVLSDLKSGASMRSYSSRPPTSPSKSSIFALGSSWTRPHGSCLVSRCHVVQGVQNISKPFNQNWWKLWICHRLMWCITWILSKYVQITNKNIKRNYVLICNLLVSQEVVQEAAARVAVTTLPTCRTALVR